MSMVENLKERFKAATQTAVKVSSDFIEVTKINLSIKSDEDNIKGIMFDIGKYIYESYNAGKPVDVELSAKCDEIAAFEKSIDEKKLKIIEIKNLKKCSGCASEIDESAAYCPNCGKKVD